MCGHVADEDPKWNKKAIADVYWKMYQHGLDGEMEIIY